MSLMLAFYNDWKTNQRRVSDFDTVSKLLESKINSSEGCRLMIDQWRKTHKKDTSKVMEEEIQFSEVF